MKTDRDPLKELQYYLDNIKGNLHVFETNVPVEKQIEYLHFTKDIKNDFSNNEQAVEEQIKILTSPEAHVREIKYALAFLAVSDSVKAYRAIEAYNETHSDDWAAMSLLQAKITMQSQFSDERQVFVYSGLGGKDDLIRFYAFFKSKNGKTFSDYQKELIEKEFPYCIKRHYGIAEEISIRDNYFTLLFLSHIHADIKPMLEEAIAECNQYGNFINKGFIITNMKAFSEEEIQEELKKK
jgi:hypothetical protein